MKYFSPTLKVKASILIIFLLVVVSCKKDKLFFEKKTSNSITELIKTLDTKNVITNAELNVWIKSIPVKLPFSIHWTQARQTVINGKHVIGIPINNDAVLFITKQNSQINGYIYKWLNLKPKEKRFSGYITSFSLQDFKMRAIVYEDGKVTRYGIQNFETGKGTITSASIKGSNTIFQAVLKAVAQAACWLAGGNWSEFNWNTASGPWCEDWGSYSWLIPGDAGYGDNDDNGGGDNGGGSIGDGFSGQDGGSGVGEGSNTGEDQVISNTYYAGDGSIWVQVWAPDQDGCTVSPNPTGYTTAPGPDENTCSGGGTWSTFEIKMPDPLADFVSPDPNLPITLPDNTNFWGEPLDPHDSNASYYTYNEANAIINQLQDEVTDDPIELYLIATYKGSELLDLSAYDIGGLHNYKIGEYYLTPSFSSNGTLLFYSAWRNSINGIEYLIQPTAIAQFITNYKFYVAAANLVYINGKPSPAMIKIMAGDYASGLKDMWGQALTDPAYLTNLAVAFVIGAAPSDEVTFINYDNITVTNKSIPNFRIDMTLDEFETNLARNAKQTWTPAPSDPTIKNLYNGKFKYTSRRVSSSGDYTVDVYYNNELKVKYRFK